ncbi:hypothetical protein HPB50_015778 [Hyalomma asiaticum]|uniref:Uncharacterized protein n=1 Tax=Hyalomma asiaticum TaxID=266040 RepID=A0ACB7SG14_HYAAI|nr:hypothetical protein HPB50_015778 [Hyalomma asiaticum]
MMDNTGNTMQPNEAEQEIMPGTSHLNPHPHSDRGDANSKFAKATGDGIFTLFVVFRKQVLRQLQLMRLMIEQLSERIERAQPVEKSCGREVKPALVKEASASLEDFEELDEGASKAREQLFCHEYGFTFLNELVDNWPGCLKRDGVHPSRFGNKVLADFLHQEAFTMSMNLERTRVHQSCRDPQASTWRGWAQQEKRPCTDQLARTFRGAGFTLVGGVRIRCKESKAWWTWDSLPSPVFYDTSVPSRGNTEGRLVEPKIPSRGA